MKNISKGFTLIELLIVMAVLGVLAAVILVAIDPVEQLARGRDAGRKSAITQLGRALQAYYTNNSVYPTVAEWQAAINILVTTGDIKVFPINPTNSSGGGPCTTAPKDGYCYDLNTGFTEVVVFARMESKSENLKCVGSPIGPVAWYGWQSSTGNSTSTCFTTSAEPFLP